MFISGKYAKIQTRFSKTLVRKLFFSPIIDIEVVANFVVSAMIKGSVPSAIIDFFFLYLNSTKAEKS
jgi:hypothetical protein